VLTRKKIGSPKRSLFENDWLQQATVQATLARHEAQVVELRLPLTPMMVAIQTALLDLIRFTINELRRINPSVLFFDLNVQVHCAPSAVSVD